MATADKTLLGYGTVTVGGTAIGLTRGGSSFVVEREYREIVADGDRGPVGTRIAVDREVAKLTVNALELFTAANLLKYYPALQNTPAGTISSTQKIVAGDLSDVVWTGATMDGKACVITVKKALNMSNLEWSLEDKNEVVPSLEFVGTYTEATRTTESTWSAVFTA